MDRVISPLKQILFAAAAAAALGACSNARWQDTGRARAPFTGDRIAEGQYSPSAPREVAAGDVLCVHSQRLRAKTETGAWALDVGTQVRTIKQVGENVQVEFASERAKAKSSCPNIFSLPLAYLNRCEFTAGYVRPATSADASGAGKPAVADSGGALGPADRYVAILNVATEKLRVYEICRGDACSANRLALEVDMLAGPDVEGRRTMLGEFRIANWNQFYEDERHLYPPFYRAGLPALPNPHAKPLEWLNPSLLPNGEGSQRGAFGWYTARLEPNADGQWLQGTWGWSEDGSRFIDLARQHAFPAGVDADSHGCTRVDNVTSAYLAALLPARTVIVRVYAQEALRFAPVKTASRRTWKWQLPNIPADAASGAALSGEYEINSIAHPVAGNKYGVPSDDLRGVFFVDAGTFRGYQHPSRLPVGGYADRVLPDALVEAK